MKRNLYQVRLYAKAGQAVRLAKFEIIAESADGARLWGLATARKLKIRLESPPYVDWLATVE